MVSLLCKTWCLEKGAALVLHVSILEKQVLIGTLHTSYGSTKHLQSVPQYNGKDRGYEKDDILTVMGMFSIFSEVKKGN